MMINGSRRFLWGERGSSSSEYAIVFALVLTLVLVTIGTLSRRTGSMWGGVDGKLIHTGQTTY
ncbi:MAG: hypothetical protein U0795_12180 [Pirellulales bacterium]